MTPGQAGEKRTGWPVSREAVPRLLAADLRPLGVTPSQAEVLRVLADHQPLTLIGLGELLICETGGSPSRLVDRLVVATSSAVRLTQLTAARSPSACRRPASEPQRR